MKRARGRRRERTEFARPDPGSRNGTRVEAALAVAGATVTGYAAAFAYQYGQSMYYGYPAEFIRVSTEWAIFASSIVLGALAAVLHGSARHSRSGKVDASAMKRRGRFWRFASIGRAVVALLCLGAAMWLVFGWTLGSILAINAGVFIFVVGFIELEESRTVWRTAYGLTLVAVGLIVLCVCGGYTTSLSTRLHQVVQGTDQMVVLYTAGAFVTASYDQTSGHLSPDYRLWRTEDASRQTLLTKATPVITVDTPSDPGGPPAWLNSVLVLRSR